VRTSVREAFKPSGQMKLLTWAVEPLREPFGQMRLLMRAVDQLGSRTRR
jgi:hypothetical protein